MNNMSKVAIGSGIVAGMVTIYAVTNDIDNQTINDKVSKMQNELSLIVDDLVKLGREVLERIYNTIVMLVNKLVYKVQTVIQDFQTRGA